MVRIYPPKTHLIAVVRNGQSYLACNKEAANVDRTTTKISECTCKACLQKVGAHAPGPSDAGREMNKPLGRWVR
jgi:hypothetical protein